MNDRTDSEEHPRPRRRLAGPVVFAGLFVVVAILGAFVYWRVTSR